MRKIIASLLGLIATLAIFIAGGQNPDGSCNLGWTLPCLLVAALCAWLFSILFPSQSVHIGPEVYDDLNKQIEDHLNEMKDKYERYEVEADNVVLTVDIHIKITTSKFKDEAWGYVKTFTETNWYCTIDVVDVVVYNEDGVSVKKHDFDESFIESEYETSHWG